MNTWLHLWQRSVLFAGDVRSGCPSLSEVPVHDAGRAAEAVEVRGDLRRSARDNGPVRLVLDGGRRRDRETTRGLGRRQPEDIVVAEARRPGARLRRDHGAPRVVRTVQKAVVIRRLR